METAVNSTAPDRRVIPATYVRQYEPLPPALGAPAACDWIGYLRYRHHRGPRNASQAAAILVAMPGFLGGASLYDPLARNVIRMAAARGRYVELWALDRRANCLEDRTGLDAADHAGDYRVALDYYYGGRAVHGRRFSGFRTSEEVPYLAEFGLAQTVRDEYAVIARGVPDPALRRRKVFCGGHSLGGSLTAAFVSWDFGGHPATTAHAGYEQCAGFFALDTVVSNNLGGGSKAVGLKGDALYAAETEGTRNGSTPRLAASLPPLTPELFQTAGIVALAAYRQAGGSSLLQELPHTANADFTLRFLLSRNAAALRAGCPIRGTIA